MVFSMVITKKSLEPQSKSLENTIKFRVRGRDTMSENMLFKEIYALAGLNYGGVKPI